MDETPVVLPPLPGTVIVRPTLEDLVEEMAHDLLSHSLNCVRAFGDFHAVLPGGDSMSALYRTLLFDPICRGIPWRRTHLWQVSEDITPNNAGHQEQSTGAQWAILEEYLCEHVGIPRNQQHPIPAQSTEAATVYAHNMQRNLEWREKGHDRPDYVLLELTRDGVIKDMHAQIAGDNNSADLYHFRQSHANQTDNQVVLTTDLVRASRFTAILVTGEDRAPFLQSMPERSCLNSPTGTHNDSGHASAKQLDPNSNQVSLFEHVEPHEGTLRWYVDHQAWPV